MLGNSCCATERNRGAIILELNLIAEKTRLTVGKYEQSS